MDAFSYSFSRGENSPKLLAYDISDAKGENGPKSRHRMHRATVTPHYDLVRENPRTMLMQYLSPRVSELSDMLKDSGRFWVCENFIGSHQREDDMLHAPYVIRPTGFSFYLAHHLK